MNGSGQEMRFSNNNNINNNFNNNINNFNNPPYPTHACALLVSARHQD